MYEEGKNLHIRDDRGRKKKILKPIIIGLIATLIIVPTVLCIVLMVRVVSLQNRVDDLLEQKENSENITQTGDEDATQVGGGSQSVEDTTGEEATSEEPTSTEDKTTSVEPLPDGKYAYLTFDDGPSENTMKILDILDQYGVKATFFVNGHTGADMEERYKAIVDRGHAIGIHTYSHNYDSVYGGLDKFEEEVVSLRKYIFEVTGKDTTLFRFPGGSSNSMVDDIYPYIQWLNDNGYVYWDWNSSSGDASGTKPTAQQIVENCLVQAEEEYTNIVILMHDLKPKDTTVEALPELIEALQAYGYEIRAIDESSKPVQHRKIQ